VSLPSGEDPSHQLGPEPGARVLDHLLDLLRSQGSLERRHAAPPVRHDRDLVGRVGEVVDDLPGELRPDAPGPVGAMAPRAALAEDRRTRSGVGRAATVAGLVREQHHDEAERDDRDHDLHEVHEPLEAHQSL
jgi:hypothetical protein